MMMIVPGRAWLRGRACRTSFTLPGLPNSGRGVDGRVLPSATNAAHYGQPRPNVPRRETIEYRPQSRIFRSLGFQELRGVDILPGVRSHTRHARAVSAGTSTVANSAASIKSEPKSYTRVRMVQKGIEP